MGAFIVDALLERNPDVDPELVEEVYCGVGLPQGLQGFNVGRIIALLSERLPLGTNGTTISRYCASSLSRSGRRATQSWRARATSTSPRASNGSRATTRPSSAPAGPERAPAGQERGRRRLHHDGPDGGERGGPLRGLARRHGRSARSARRSCGRLTQENGYFDREIVPVTLPDGTVVSKDDGRGRRRRSRSSPSSTLSSRRTARSRRATPAR